MTSSKRFNVVGIGNAIVDLLAHVDDDFITAWKLEKGTTRLIDKEEAARLHKAIKVVNEVSGGSAANTTAGLASLGSSVAFIGKVQNDDFGRSFKSGLTSCGVNCNTKMASSGPSTALCIVLVTPDAERTMNTYLGISASLGPEDVDDNIIRDSKVAYLEGYLWDRPEAKEAFLKTIDIAHSSGGKTALSLSGPFCVARHKSEFLDLIKDRIDILFGNEEEMKSLFDTDSFGTVSQACRDIGLITAITRGKMGSVIITHDETYTIEVNPIKKLVDTTGAGDMYAAGFLHGLTNGLDLQKCGRIGSIAGAEIVGHFGARPEVPLVGLISKVGILI